LEKEILAGKNYFAKSRYFNSISNQIFTQISGDGKLTPVTPIQGPIYIKNDSVPVLPLYAYPKVYNGTFMQIPVSRKIYFIIIYDQSKRH
jgi:hypothetical protein